MPDTKNPVGEDQKNQAGKKENNPSASKKSTVNIPSIRSRRTISSKRAAGHSQCPGADWKRD